jgi:hypothetical protein
MMSKGGCAIIFYFFKKNTLSRLVWLEIQAVHAFTFTSRLVQHGTMYCMWKKTHTPHRNGQRKAMQNQKAA